MLLGNSLGVLKIEYRNRTNSVVLTLMQRATFLISLKAKVMDLLNC